MNIKQLTTKLQEEATKIAMVKYQGQAEQFCFTKTQLENVLAEAVNQTLAYVSEEVEDMQSFAIWLAGLYQKNWNTFAPHKNPNAPDWKKEAYMHFATVQGMQLREKIKVIADMPFEDEKVHRAIQALTDIQKILEVKE